MKSVSIIILSVFMFRSTIAEEIIQGQGRFTSMTILKCNNSVLCATSPPSKKFDVRSKSTCTFECQHRPESCVGVNYEEIGDNLSCEIFSANPTNYSKNVPGCQYIQVHSWKSANVVHWLPIKLREKPQIDARLGLDKCSVKREKIKYLCFKFPPVP